MQNVKQKFSQNHFLQPDDKDILKDVKIRLIHKTGFWLDQAGILVDENT